MRTLLVALGIGLAAAVLDTAPMLARRLPARSVASAFIQWLVLGLIIVYLRTPLPSWANGLIAGLLCALPIVIIISGNEPRSAPIVLGTSLVLGTLCGFAAGLLA